MCKSRATHRALITCNISSPYHVQHIEPLSRATHRALITCNISSPYHVQHIEPLSRATHRALITCNTSSPYHVQYIVCHAVRRNSSAIKFDRVEIAFILALFHWLKSLTSEGGEETGVPGENPLTTSFRVRDRQPPAVFSRVTSVTYKLLP